MTVKDNYNQDLYKLRTSEDAQKQINAIEMDYYNSTHRTWFDERHELGDWFIVVDHERGNADYTIRIEVIYWE